MDSMTGEGTEAAIVDNRPGGSAGRALAFAAGGLTVAAAVVGFTALSDEQAAGRGRVALAMAVAAAALAAVRLVVGRGAGRGVDGDVAIGSLLLSGVMTIALAVGPATPAPRPTTQPRVPGPIPGNCGPGCTVVEGRPLRRRRRTLRPDVRVGRVRATATLEPDLTPRRQAAVAEAWLTSARHEHASVAAFARLARDLHRLGAPVALVTAARRAALEEVDHARRCFALASRYAGRPLTAGAIRGRRDRPARLRSRRAEVVRLAVEAVTDGAMNEGYVARLNELQADAATDADVARHLRSIAADEARHAELGWSTLDWCLEVGGDDVRRAVRAAAERIPRTVGVGPDDADCAAALAAHGHAGGDAAAALWRDVRRDVVERVLTAAG